MTWIGMLKAGAMLQSPIGVNYLECLRTPVTHIVYMP